MNAHRGSALAIACVALLAGAAGCSDAYTVRENPTAAVPPAGSSNQEGGASSSSAGAATPAQTDGGSDPMGANGSDSGGTPTGACVPQTVSAVVSIAPWNPPTKVSGACTASDAAAFETSLSTNGVTPAALEGSVSASCASCLFTQTVSASSWQLYVWTDKAKNAGFLNTDACLNTAGVSKACASADSTAARCAQAACDAAPACATADMSTYESCLLNASESVCNDESVNADDACPSAPESSALLQCGFDQQGNLTDWSKLVLKVCG